MLSEESEGVGANLRAAGSLRVRDRLITLSRPLHTATAGTRQRSRGEERAGPPPR